jgi:hypothetical protein
MPTFKGKIFILLLCLFSLTVLSSDTALSKTEDKQKKKPPTLTDQVMINSIKSLLETGEQPTPNRVANLAKEKIESWNYYFEQAYVKGYLKNPQNLMRQKEKSIRMMQDIDKRAAEARRQNRPSAVQRIVRFLSSPLRGPIKITGKIREAIEKILPEQVRPIFRVLAGKYMLDKYKTLAERQGFDTSHLA